MRFIGLPCIRKNKMKTSPSPIRKLQTLMDADKREIRIESRIPFNKKEIYVAARSNRNNEWSVFISEHWSSVCGHGHGKDLEEAIRTSLADYKKNKRTNLKKKSKNKLLYWRFPL